jgi:hypothetical protein
MLAWVRRNLDIYRSDFGRKCGWFVESGGRRVAELVDSVWDSDEQFWHVYRVVPLTEVPNEFAAIFSDEFWYRPGIVFENRKYGTRVTDALAGFMREERGAKVIPMRNLYVPVSFRLLWEFVCLFLPERRWRNESAWAQKRGHSGGQPEP